MNDVITPEVHIPCGKFSLPGLFTMPEDAKGIVIFAHGSGSSHLSPRNQYVAQEIQSANKGTLLFDLLTREEEQFDVETNAFRFNISLLASRLINATEWVRQQFPKQSIGYFGASTGAAAALVASTHKKLAVKAVVSRGGRPDLAGLALQKVNGPTLLLVGSLDLSVIELNKFALAKLNGVKKLEIVPGASHLFEEPGKLAEVASLATKWFSKYLA